MDNHTPEQRHFNMSRIANKNTKPGEKVKKYLFSQGFRYRKNDKRYPGHPDFVLLDQKIAVFVDGCFWHGHDCRNTRPADHQEYWQRKRERNIQHDHEITVRFEARGWTVIRIWECELKKKNIVQLSGKLSILYNRRGLV